MSKTKYWLLVLMMIGFYSCADNTGLNCSTFMFETGESLFVGHNLDEDPDLHVPGMVCINKRGIIREGITWYELIADPPDFEKTLVPFEDKQEPKIRWISKYGSVTFNSEGLDFPDGGINEQGLSVFEMSLGHTQHSHDPNKPTLFITLWIQYQLDNYATVEEVVENMYNLNQQGWSWHYFISDKTGDFAIVEYIRGEIKIRRNENAPCPVLCNSSYKKELKRLEDYKSALGSLRYLFASTPRFIRAEKMLNEYEQSSDELPRDYGFEILDEIKIDGWNKWGILVDVSNMVVYYHTNKNRKRKSVSFRNLDFTSGTPTQMLDIHMAEISGNVEACFEDYTYELNFNHNLERAEWLFKERFYGLIDNGVTAEVYAKRFADYSERIRQKNL